MKSICMLLTFLILSYHSAVAQESLVRTYLDSAWEAYCSGRLEEATDLYRQAINEAEKPGVNRLYLAGGMFGMALCKTAMGQYVGARPLYKKAVTIRKEGLGQEHELVAPILNSFGLNYYYEDKFSEAIDTLNEAMEIYVKTKGEESHEVGNVYHNLALVYDGKEDYAKSEELFRKGRGIYEKTLNDGHADMGESSYMHALHYFDWGKLDLSRDHFEMAIKVYRKLPNGGMKLLDALTDYLDLCKEMNNQENARELQAEIDKITKSTHK